MSIRHNVAIRHNSIKGRELRTQRALLNLPTDERMPIRGSQSIYPRRGLVSSSLVEVLNLPLMGACRQWGGKAYILGEHSFSINLE